jgi:hypothetical protein
MSSEELKSATLASWAADLLLVGLKNLYVFFKRVAGAWNKKKH